MDFNITPPDGLNPLYGFARMKLKECEIGKYRIALTKVFTDENLKKSEYHVTVETLKDGKGGYPYAIEHDGFTTGGLCADSKKPAMNRYYYLRRMAKRA